MPFKRGFINRVVEVSKTDYKNRWFWAREMKIMNYLCENYGDETFLNSIDLGFKLNSLAWLKSGKGKEEIDRLWTIFNYNPEKEKKIYVVGKKQGKSTANTKPKKQTTLGFLDG